VSRFFDIVRKSQEQMGDSSAFLDGTAENIEKACDPPQIPVEEAHIQPESRVVFHTDPRGPSAERFRFLRMRLRELWNAGKLRSLLITSPLPGDGKSTIAMNLATALAEQGKRSVLLVEADLHRSSLTQQLGLESRPGLAECLEDGLNPMSAVRRLEPLGWYLLSSGTPRSNPTELLQSEAVSGIMQELAPYFDWILIDSPPVAPLSDALCLARQADASLLVVRAGRTPREVVEQTLALLGPEHVLGVLLNGVEGLDRLYSKYYGYYGHVNSSPTSGRSGKRGESVSQQPIQPKH
jgi:capsular exopolysaccharide synthesis family protein